MCHREVVFPRFRVRLVKYGIGSLLEVFHVEKEKIVLCS